MAWINGNTSLSLGFKPRIIAQKNLDATTDSTAVQAVRYAGHRSIVLKHIGSAKDDTEPAVLIQIATLTLMAIHYC
jgi:hypothetical protein